jgi:hypothetical protein
VGKTTLVEHFLERVAQEQPEVLIGKGVCATETEMSGLTPFVELLESVGKRLRFTSDKWVDFIKNVAPAWIDILPSISLPNHQNLSGRPEISRENGV